jgi:hypothetical protein
MPNQDMPPNTEESLKPKRPIHAMKDILILCLKTFFSTHEEFTWSPNPKESKISITDAFPINKDVKENFPCIAVQRHPFTWRSGHLNQTVYTNLQDKHSGLDLLKGSFSCLCASTLGLESERLAEDVFLFFTRYRGILAEKGLYDVKDLVIGDESIRSAGADTDVVVVPVKLGASIEDAWTVIETGNPLEDFTIRLKSIN